MVSSGDAVRPNVFCTCCNIILFNCDFLAFTCSLAANSGVTCGSGSTYRFFYNAQTQECDSFQYNGCDGNSNNFNNREDCEGYCGVGGHRDNDFYV